MKVSVQVGVEVCSIYTKRVQTEVMLGFDIVDDVDVDLCMGKVSQEQKEEAKRDEETV